MQGRCSKCGMHIISRRSRCPVCEGGVEPIVSVPRPKIVEPKAWPDWAAAWARIAKHQDAGVGDTAQRFYASFGGEWFKLFAKKIGMPCRCSERQAEWNTSYPYHPIDVTVVTSLSPREQHAESQSRAIETWRKYGVYIVSVNTQAEADNLCKRFQQVDEWVVNNDEVSWGSGRKSQPIRRMVQVAADKERPILIINSDIEIHGKQKSLLEYVPVDCVTLGVRWNYSEKHSDATEFQWGFDVVGVLPEHARKLPKSFNYGIGQPVWDYAAPMILSDCANVIHGPLFFHKNHPLNWDSVAWDQGAKMFAEWFGKIDHENTAWWRQQFEPDMIYDERVGCYVSRASCPLV